MIRARAAALLGAVRLFSCCRVRGARSRADTVACVLSVVLAYTSREAKELCPEWEVGRETSARFETAERQGNAGAALRRPALIRTMRGDAGGEVRMSGQSICRYRAGVGIS